MKNKKINWKINKIGLLVEEVLILGHVHWWSKEYFIEIYEPKRVKLAGARMLLSLPCKFVYGDPSEKHEFSIIEQATRQMQDYFQKNLKKLRR